MSGSSSIEQASVRLSINGFRSSLEAEPVDYHVLDGPPAEMLSQADFGDYSAVTGSDLHMLRGPCGCRRRTSSYDGKPDRTGTHLLYYGGPTGDRCQWTQSCSPCITHCLVASSLPERQHALYSFVSLSHDSASAFPAKSVPAPPPSADTHSRPLAEISSPAHSQCRTNLNST